MNPPSLRSFQRVLQGGGLIGRIRGAAMWSMGDMAVSYALRLAGNLVLTRLLMPEAFGLMAVVTAFLVGLELMTDASVHRSVVRSPRGAEPLFLRVAWTVQILRGLAIAVLVLLLAGILALLAPAYAPAGSIYADPVLPPLLAASAVMPLLRGAESTNLWLADRQLRLARMTALNLTSQALGLAATIAFAAIWMSVWAFFAGMLVAPALRVLLSHLLYPQPRMGWARERDILHEIWSLGKWLLLSSALTFVTGQADRLILAALLGARAFSFYTIALMWVQAYMIGVQRLISQIAMAAFSEVHRDRPAEFPRAYRRFARVVDILGLAGAALFLVAGPAGIRLLYPEDYHDVGHLIPLLAPLILTARFDLLGIAALAMGDSRLLAWNSALTAVALCLGLIAGFRLAGTEGAILAVIVARLPGALLYGLRLEARIPGVARECLLWIAVICGAAALASLRG